MPAFFDSPIPSMPTRLESLRLRTLDHLAETSNLIADEQATMKTLAELLASMARTMHDIVYELQDDQFERAKSEIVARHQADIEDLKICPPGQLGAKLKALGITPVLVGSPSRTPAFDASRRPRGGPVVTVQHVDEPMSVPSRPKRQRTAKP